MTDLKRSVSGVMIMKPVQNKDLYHDVLKDLTRYPLQTVMEDQNVKVRRMDSMIDRNPTSAKSAGMELIYTCIAKLAVYVDKSMILLCLHDLKNTISILTIINRIVYHQCSTDADERMKQLLRYADKLVTLWCESGYNDSTEV